MIRRFSSLSVLLLLFFLGVTVASSEVIRPNVLFIAVDDLNHWVGYFNRYAGVKTPNIDRLSQQGVSFTRAYCTAPACNPSRASLMTGRYPNSSGVYENSQDFRPHLPSEWSLVTAFRKAGYLTVGAGKIYHGAYDRTHEWEKYQSPSEYSDKILTNAQIEKQLGFQNHNGIRFGPMQADDDAISDTHNVSYSIAHLQEKHERPFFLSVGIQKPHLPWSVPQKYFDLYPLDSIELPPHQADDLLDIPAAGLKMAKPDGDHKSVLDANQWKQAIQAYLASISYADAQIGRLLDALEASEYRDNTIVVFFGDHGWHLGEKQHWRKFALWEEAARAPLIWKVPGLTPEGQLCARPVDFASFFPTLMEVTGLKKPDHLQGVSLLPLLQNPQEAWNHVALTTHIKGNHAIRSEDWSYLRYSDGSEELYHTKADPYEWKNLASDPQHQAFKAELQQHLPKHDQDNVPFRNANPSQR